MLRLSDECLSVPKIRLSKHQVFVFWHLPFAITSARGWDKHILHSKLDPGRPFLDCTPEQVSRRRECCHQNTGDLCALTYPFVPLNMRQAFLRGHRVYKKQPRKGLSHRPRHQPPVVHVARPVAQAQPPVAQCPPAMPSPSSHRVCYFSFVQ